MPEHTLDTILDLLDTHRRRATYGAVAKLLNRAPTFLMSGRSRDQRHSWVVNQRTGMPTGYQPEQVHPELMSQTGVLETAEQLQEWLNEVEAPAATPGS